MSEKPFDLEEFRDIIFSDPMGSEPVTNNEKLNRIAALQGEVMG